MLERAHRQLLDTIHRRMELNGGMWITGPGWALFDIGTTVADSHLRGAVVDPGCEIPSLLEQIDALRTPDLTEWPLRIHPDALSEVRESLIEAGYHLTDEQGYPIMAITHPVERDVLHNVTVVPLSADGETMMEDAIGTLMSAFTKLDTKEAELLLLNRQWTSDPNWRAAVIYDADTVVSMGLLTRSANSATSGLYYISTNPELRGRGLAKDLCATLTNLAFERGDREVILQASALGEFVYTRLGYREIGRYYSMSTSAPESCDSAPTEEPLIKTDQ